MKPHVGDAADPFDSADGGCLFHGQTRADPRCPAPATQHLMIQDIVHGMVSVATCAEHEPIARASGLVVREHQHEGVCGMPAAIWLDPPENRCALDASGVSRARVKVGEMAPA